MASRDERLPTAGRLEVAPAKVNFGLRVLGRRADGYHLIESLFVPVDLSDEVFVETAPAPEPRVALDCVAAPDASGLGDLPEGDDNLAFRAAEAFLAAGGVKFSVSLKLVKRIPLAAGLGGGSSDAGAVLRALRALIPGALTPRGLAALALSLGADVPFFLSPRPALVEGIGEQVTPVDGLSELSLVLANPGESLSTASVFEAWDALSPTLTTVQPGSTMRSLSDWITLDPKDPVAHWARLSEFLRNDLEGAARQICPSIGRIQRHLVDLGAQAVGMSGSGATSFGIFKARSEAKSAIKQLALRGEGWSRLAGTLPDG